MNAGTRVQDSRPRYQRLEAEPHWHMGKRITKHYRQLLLINGESGYMHVRKRRISLWTSAKLKRSFSESPPYTTSTFQSHQQGPAVYETHVMVRVIFCRCFLKGNEVSESDRTDRKNRIERHFW